MNNIDKILPTKSEVDALMSLGSVIEETSEKIIESGDLKKVHCQYHNKKTNECSMPYCKHDHRSVSELCRVKGLIEDLHKEKESVHNYFQSRGKL